MFKAAKLLSEIFNKKYKRYFYWLVLLAVVVSLFEILGIGGILYFINSILKDPSIYSMELWGYLGVKNDENDLIIMIVGCITMVILIFRGLLILIYTWAQQKYKFACNHYLSMLVMKTYLYKNYEYFLMNNTESMVKNIVDEVFRVTEQVIGPVVTIVTQLVIVFVIVSFVFIYKPDITLLLVFGTLPIAYLIFLLVKNKMYAIGVESLKYNSLRFRNAGEALRGIKETKIYKVENFFYERFKKVSLKFSNIQVLANTIPEIPRIILETIAFIVLLLLMIIQSKNGGAIEGVLPTVVVLALSAYRVMPSINKIVNGVAKIRFGIPSLELVYDILSKNQSNNNNLMINTGVIDNNSFIYKDISYSYPNAEKQSLDNVSINLLKGNVTGVAGRSGSGKTTLIDIVAGLLGISNQSNNNESNSNLIDNLPVISYVTQNIFLIDGSIKDNIVYGLDDNYIDFNWLDEVIKLAQLDDYVSGQIDGINSKVGDAGKNISGGQLQRIGIARALYRKPDLLIFDEATSALDGITENYINKSIEQCAANNIAVLIVAHRMSTISWCDYVYLLESSELIGKGTYDQLLAENATFKKLYETQNV